MSAKVDGMLNMVERYSQDLPSHVHDPSKATPQGDVVLLTGTTGGLGAEILSTLAADPSISKVFAVNRPNPAVDLLARQKATFAERGLDPSALDSGKVDLVEADLSLPGFGLPEYKLSEVGVCELAGLV
jgi:NAD(P)-dependent dehydrogenase (short-subunit alcohol dehydrogenase family)